MPLASARPLDDSPASLHTASPGLGPMPWIVGGLCLISCWPLGIPALITATIARSAGRQSADAVRAGDLYEGARLLARSRRYRSISLGCSAVGVLIVFALLLLVALGTTAEPGFSRIDMGG